MYFSSNIRILRKRKNRTQEVAAQALGFTRSTLNSYENGAITNPTVEALINFSTYFKVSIDTLIRIDMSKLSELQLRELELGHDAYVRGTKLRVLATTVDSKNRENIELVPVKAKAGYTAGYNDPEYIRNLPTFQLPFLSPDKKFRTFQISGDSMLPIPDKSYVTAEFVENWMEVKDGNAYIILTQDDGIVFKVVFNHISNMKKLLLKSLNPIYKPYEINISEVKEIWKFVNYISNELPETNFQNPKLSNTVAKIQSEMNKIKDLLGVSDVN
jgi:transcriptional regulator with XRE-family HTH domain